MGQHPFKCRPCGTSYLSQVPRVAAAALGSVVFGVFLVFSAWRRARSARAPVEPTLPLWVVRATRPQDMDVSWGDILDDDVGAVELRRGSAGRRILGRPRPRSPRPDPRDLRQSARGPDAGGRDELWSGSRDAGDANAAPLRRARTKGRAGARSAVAPSPDRRAQPRGHRAPRAPAQAQTHHAYFAACPKGLERVLADELRGIGAEGVEEGLGGCSFGGGRRVGYEAILWLRTANRVMECIATDDCVNSPEV